MKTTISTKKTIKKITKKPSVIKKSIKKDMTFAQILTKNPELMNTLFEHGLHCIGCHMSAYETIEQGCLVHGMNNKEIDALVEKLNKQIEKKK